MAVGTAGVIVNLSKLIVVRQARLQIGKSVLLFTSKNLFPEDPSMNAG